MIANEYIPFIILGALLIVYGIFCYKNKKAFKWTGDHYFRGSQAEFAGIFYIVLGTIAIIVSIVNS